MSNPENTKFMDLTLEEQLDLVSYVLQGNTLSSRRSECENFLEVVNDKPTVLTFRWDHMFKKNPSRLENLIKQKENLEKEIADLMAKESSETALIMQPFAFLLPRGTLANLPGVKRLSSI